MKIRNMNLRVRVDVLQMWTQYINRIYISSTSNLLRNSDEFIKIDLWGSSQCNRKFNTAYHNNIISIPKLTVHCWTHVYFHFFHLIRMKFFGRVNTHLPSTVIIWLNLGILNWTFSWTGALMNESETDMRLNGRLKITSNVPRAKIANLFSIPPEPVLPLKRFNKIYFAKPPTLSRSMLHRDSQNWIFVSNHLFNS